MNNTPRNKTLRVAILCLLCFFIQSIQSISAFGDEQSEKWWAEEQECIANCPELPRFSDTETDAQYVERMKKTEEYNICQRQCIREYMNKVQIRHRFFDDGSKSYFKRNE